MSVTCPKCRTRIETTDTEFALRSQVEELKSKLDEAQDAASPEYETYVPVGYVPLMAVNDLEDARRAKQPLSYRYIFAGETSDGHGKAVPVYRLPPNLPALIEQAKAEEREECARICKESLMDGTGAIAAAIRARKPEQPAVFPWDI